MGILLIPLVFILAMIWDASVAKHGEENVKNFLLMAGLLILFVLASL